MFNVTISEDTYSRLKKKGYVFEYAEKMLTIRGQYYEPLVEFLWDESRHLVIVLTRYKVFYADKISISGQRNPVIFMVDKKGIGRSITSKDDEEEAM